MSKGIAKLFRKTFGRMEELEKANANVGDTIYLKEGRQFIYYLVTKEKYSDKPTYDTLRLTLMKMKDHAVKNKIMKISIPKIGCGRDNLRWDVVKPMIQNVFVHTEIEISVYLLGMNSNTF